MGQLNDVEYARLETEVRQIEKRLMSGVPGSDDLLLKNFLNGAKSRMEEIRHEGIQDEDSKKERKEREAAMAVQLAEMEHKLSAEEKEKYAGFIELEYFTKKNFKALEEFYTNSWERLSEDGKDRMSDRVWGGIKRNEFRFEELPEKMREKESERIYQQLTGAIEPSAHIRNVTAQSKAEFIREYEDRNEKATSKILSGGDFAGYCPDNRKETSGSDVSLARKKEPAVPSQAKHPQVTEDPEAVIEGLTRTAAGLVSPSRLPASTGSSVGKA